MKKKNSIIIRFATEADIPAIMKFIDTHWRKGHILGRDEQFFRYEWTCDGQVTVALALDGDEIVGLEGFIPYGKKNRDVTTTLWKVLKTRKPMLGIAILDFIRNNVDGRMVSGQGINANTLGIYQRLDLATGKMTQWYRLNPAVKDFRIAAVKNPSIPLASAQELSPKVRLTKYENFSDLTQDFSFDAYIASNPLPLKESWYVNHRYFQHPIYHYDVYGAGTQGAKADALVVFRIQECQGARALRLVDIIGNTERLYCLTPLIDKLLSEEQAEYVDIYEKGLSADAMEKAGWLTVATSGNIIPNYFAPFVQQNVDILYYTSEPRLKLFKADGDQDRPN